nr:hypothetical protein [bacterium]
HEVVNPSAASLSAVEQKRTNASDGSLRDRQRRIEEQDESIQIEGLGASADRRSKLTEKDLIKAEAAAEQIPLDSARSSDTQDTRPIIERTPEQLDRKTHSLAIEYQERRTTSQVVTDFLTAAQTRALDPEAKKLYIQGQIDKVTGIYKGLDLAKEETKSSARVAWTALNDGTAANFLSQPNAINDPMFKVVTGSLDVMARDKHAVNNALTHMGGEIIRANDSYNKLPDSEKGHVIGKAMFAMVNPEGSTETGQAALKVAEHVATHVDKAVIDQFAHMTKQISSWSVSAPEKALQGKQYLYDLSKTLKLTGPELEFAGIPKGYFSELHGVEASEKLIEGKADDHILRMSPWYERGKSHPISADKAAKRAGIEKSDLQNLTKEQLNEAGLSYLPKPYRQLYLEANPQYANYPGGLQVHHRIPQDVLKLFPQLFGAEEVNALANLRGLPNRAGAHGQLSQAWRIFLRNENLTRQDILDYANLMDARFGRSYLP